MTEIGDAGDGFSSHCMPLRNGLARGSGMTEETLFHEALTKLPGERAAFLERACAGQPQLRAAVETLLAAHERSGNVLDKPAAVSGQTVDSEPGPAPPPVTGEHTSDPAAPCPPVVTTD